MLDLDMILKIDCFSENKKGESVGRFLFRFSNFQQKARIDSELTKRTRFLKNIIKIHE